MEENIVFFKEHLKDHVPSRYRGNLMKTYPQIWEKFEYVFTPWQNLTIDFYYPFAFQWFPPHYLGKHARTYIPLPVRLFYQFEKYSLKIKQKYESKLEFKSHEQLIELEHYMKVYFHHFQSAIFHTIHEQQSASSSQESGIDIEYPEPRFRATPYNLLFIYNKPIERVCVLGTCCGCRNWGSDGYILSIDDCSVSPVHQLRRDDICCYVGVDFLMSNGISIKRSDILGAKFLIYGHVTYSDFDEEIGINVDDISIVSSLQQEFEHYKLMEVIAGKLLNGEPWFLPRATEGESQKLEKIVSTFPQYLQTFLTPKSKDDQNEHEKKHKPVIDQRAWLQQEVEMTHLNVFLKNQTSLTESESLKTDKMYLASSLPKDIDQTLCHKAFFEMNPESPDVDILQDTKSSLSFQFLNARSNVDDEEVDLLEGFDISNQLNLMNDLMSPTENTRDSDMDMDENNAPVITANEESIKGDVTMKSDLLKSMQNTETYETEVSLNIEKSSTLLPEKLSTASKAESGTKTTTETGLDVSGSTTLPLQQRIITSKPALSPVATEKCQSPTPTRSTTTPYKLEIPTKTGPTLSINKNATPDQNTATPNNNQNSTPTPDELYEDYRNEFMDQLIEVVLLGKLEAINKNSFPYTVPELSVKLGNFAKAITKMSLGKDSEVLLKDQKSLKRRCKAFYENNKLMAAQKVTEDFAKENPLVFLTEKDSDRVSLSNFQKVFMYLVEKILKMVALRLTSFKIVIDETFCKNIEGLELVEQSSVQRTNDVGLSVEFIEKMLKYLMKRNSSVENGTVKKWMITSQQDSREICIRCRY
ncbi:hypothetical protein ACO0QE_002834 [Hanseniaspora vineae]